jgi:putative membrane protein
MDEQTRFSTTMALHFGYGTVVGALYAPLADTVPGCSPLKGMAFGVLVWAGSYLGWLPMSGLLSSATRHTAARNALMIAAHLLWGSVIALIVQHAERGKSNGTDTVRNIPCHRRAGER